MSAVASDEDVEGLTSFSFEFFYLIK